MAIHEHKYSSSIKWVCIISCTIHLEPKLARKQRLVIKKIKLDVDLGFTTIALFLLQVLCAKAQPRTFDIRKYGALPNGDITSALTNAWKEACASTSASQVLIPNTTYKLRQINLQGPCKAPIEVHVDGVILAPADPSQFNGNAQWVQFQHVNFFTLSGKGTFDGQGQTAWKQNNCAKNINCKMLSMNFGFNFLNNAVIQDITSKDSKSFHVNVFRCKKLKFSNFIVTALETSPNTDGIHIGRSSEINITNTNNGTGDDCISLGDGSRFVNLLNVTCGPGHGISVGSLGRYPNEEPVQGFTVRNCTLINTSNGLRIKTWPGTLVASTASEMHYEHILMVNVRNPIIIDQEYCPNNQCSKQTPSKVRINHVTFKKIHGTSVTKDGVTLICSSSVPCENVQLSDIDLTFNGAPVIAKCTNVKPIIQGKAPTYTV